MKTGKASTNGAGRSTKTTTKILKRSGMVKEMTAREATLRVWQKTYKTHDKGLG